MCVIVDDLLEGKGEVGDAGTGSLEGAPARASVYKGARRRTLQQAKGPPKGLRSHYKDGLMGNN